MRLEFSLLRIALGNRYRAQPRWLFRAEDGIEPGLALFGGRLRDDSHEHVF